MEGCEVDFEWCHVRRGWKYSVVDKAGQTWLGAGQEIAALLSWLSLNTQQFVPLESNSLKCSCIHYSPLNAHSIGLHFSSVLTSRRSSLLGPHFSALTSPRSSLLPSVLTSLSLMQHPNVLPAVHSEHRTPTQPRNIAEVSSTVPLRRCTLPGVT